MGIRNSQRLGPFKVAVLAGGDSSERTISLASGRAVSRALIRRGHYVTELDPAAVDLTQAGISDYDVAFLALHGQFGEDGQVQETLERIGIPYTGSDAEWATMAREAAHQLGTPLSSLAGWVEILRMKADERAEVAPDEMIAREVEVDVDRLNKVAQRFELIGLRPQMQSVSIVDVLSKLQKYFSARLPRQQNAIRLEIDYVPDIPKVIGNPVLLEWAFENIIKNSIDVLAGRGGNILIKVRTVDAKVHIHFCDDGPGVAPDRLGKTTQALRLDEQAAADPLIDMIKRREADDEAQLFNFEGGIDDDSLDNMFGL